jgi:hypothetical protein
VIRTDPGRVIMKIIDSNPEGRRTMGSPRLRGLDDENAVLLRELAVKVWRQRARRHPSIGVLCLRFWVKMR